jgi:hypothetical protein
VKFVKFDPIKHLFILSLTYFYRQKMYKTYINYKHYQKIAIYQRKLIATVNEAVGIGVIYQRMCCGYWHCQKKKHKKFANIFHPDFISAQIKTRKNSNLLTLFLSLCNTRKEEKRHKRKKNDACDKGKHEQYLSRHQSPMRSAILCDFNSNLQRPGRFECVCLLIY